MRAWRDHSQEGIRNACVPRESVNARPFQLVRIPASVESLVDLCGHRLNCRSDFDEFFERSSGMQWVTHQFLPVTFGDGIFSQDSRRNQQHPDIVDEAAESDRAQFLIGKPGVNSHGHGEKRRLNTVTNRIAVIERLDRLPHGRVKIGLQMSAKLIYDL